MIPVGEGEEEFAIVAVNLGGSVVDYDGTPEAFRGLAGVMGVVPGIKIVKL